MTTTRTRRDAAYFEQVYRDAHGDREAIPWSDGKPHPALVNWLNAVAPSLVRCGARVAVVGCGLGEDARELLGRGYDVVAFDCSETAIDWCRRLDPEHVESYHVADLFDPPARWKHRFDLVIESNTIQALEPDRRAATVQAVADLVAPHGHLLVIARHARDPVRDDDGPPWPIDTGSLMAHTGRAGLEPEGEVQVFLDGEDPPVRRVRALFHRRARTH